MSQSRSLAVEIISIRTLPQAVETDTQLAKTGYRKSQHRQHTVMLYFAQSIDLLARHCLLCIPLLRSFVPRLLVFLVSYAQIVAKRPRQVIELIDELRGFDGRLQVTLHTLESTPRRQEALFVASRGVQILIVIE